MNITLYRYEIKGAKWSPESLDQPDLEKAQEDMIKLPFQGREDESKYGIASCLVGEDIIYGTFVQKFPTTLTHFDSDTKEESTVDENDTGIYIFIIFPKDLIIYLQAKRSGDLPSKEEILNRFIMVMKLANQNNKLLFDGLDSAEDYVDRDKIVDIFYNQAEAVTELNLEGFDPDIIHKQRKKRGRRQTYFNPKEEWQEAAEEEAIRFAENTDKVNIKAKQGQSFKKDPVARVMLEGSAKPSKIVYRKNSETITQYGITRSKEVIFIPTDFNLDEDFEEIISYLKGERREGKDRLTEPYEDDSNQTKLV